MNACIQILKLKKGAFVLPYLCRSERCVIGEFDTCNAHDGYPGVQSFLVAHQLSKCCRCESSTRTRSTLA